MNLRITKTVEIKTAKEWELYAPPMKKNHLKDGRSARSLARFITDKNNRHILEDVLKGLGYKLRGEILCVPEAKTQLPGKGNGRNHDLLMIGRDFVVGIESKVTESFGGIIEEELSKASHNKRHRINALVNELFNCEVNEDIEDLRYQLLTGAVGTLLEAIKNNKEKALFLVIVFTDKNATNSEKKASKNNHKDFVDFCRCLNLSDEGGTKTVLGVDFTVKEIEVSLKE